MKYRIVVTETTIATYIVDANSEGEAAEALRSGDLCPKTHTIEEYSEEVELC